MIKLAVFISTADHVSLKQRYVTTLWQDDEHQVDPWLPMLLALLIGTPPHAIPRHLLFTPPLFTPSLCTPPLCTPTLFTPPLCTPSLRTPSLLTGIPLYAIKRTHRVRTDLLLCAFILVPLATFYMAESPS